MIIVLTILAILSVLFSFFSLFGAALDPNEADKRFGSLLSVYFLLFGVFLLLLAILIKINPFW